MNWLTLVTVKSFLLSLCPKKLEVAKIILVHLLQAYEILKTGGRVAARRKRRIVRAFSPSLRRRLEGKAGAQKHLQDCILNEGGVREKTEADSSKLEIFNCVISAHGEANRAVARCCFVGQHPASSSLSRVFKAPVETVSTCCWEWWRLVVKRYARIRRNITNRSLQRTFVSKGNPTASSPAATKENLTGNLVALYLIREIWTAVSNFSAQILKPLLADQFVPYSNSYRSNSHWPSEGSTKQLRAGWLLNPLTRCSWFEEIFLSV